MLDVAFLEATKEAIARYDPRISLAPGLSSNELLQLERTFSCTLSSDIASWLRYVVPVGPGFPDWRVGLEYEYEEATVEICTCLADIGVWNSAWGREPEAKQDKVVKLLQLLLDAPRLIRVFGNRCIAVNSRGRRDALFSVEGCDIVNYEGDLHELLDALFVHPRRLVLERSFGWDAFWDQVMYATSRRRPV